MYDIYTKNPKTNPKLEKVEYFESKFDFGPLIDEAVKNVETLTISKHDDLNQQKTNGWMNYFNTNVGMSLSLK